MAPCDSNERCPPQGKQVEKGIAERGKNSQQRIKKTKRRLAGQPLCYLSPARHHFNIEASSRRQNSGIALLEMIRSDTHQENTQTWAACYQKAVCHILLETAVLQYSLSAWKLSCRPCKKVGEVLKTGKCSQRHSYENETHRGTAAPTQRCFSLLT